MSIVATVSYPQMTLNIKRLDDLGSFTPSNFFQIEQSEDPAHTKKPFSCYYRDADESFWGTSIEEVVNKITSFLKQDACIEKVGKPTIKKVFSPKVTKVKIPILKKNK